MAEQTQHINSGDIHVGTKVLYKGIVGTVYRVNKQIGFFSKTTFDLEVNDISAEDLTQIVK